MHTSDSPFADQHPQTNEMFDASYRLLTPFPRLRRCLRALRATLSMPAGLFLALFPHMVSAEGNPFPTSGIFHVSPTGNDAANGDASAPLATLGKAKDLATVWIHQQDGDGNYVNPAAEIILRGGRY